MKKWFWQIITSFVLLAVWQIFSFSKIVNPILLPSPTEVAESLWHLFADNTITPDLLDTIVRLSIGLSIGSMIGVAAGLLIGYFKKIKQLSGFWLDFFRSLPPAALIPLFLLLFGIGNLAKVLLIIFASSLIIIVSTIYGVSNTNSTRLMWAKSAGLSNAQIFWHIILPESLPHISAGMRHAISFSLMLTIVEEMLMGGVSGLGKKINDYHLILETSSMYAVIIITGILGYALNKLYLIFETRKIHWAGK